MRASVAVVAFCLSFSVVAQEQGASLSLKVGESVELSAKGFTRIAVEDPSVVDVRPGAELFTATGLRAGTTRILVWREGRKEERSVTVTGSGVAQAPAPKSPAAALPDERISMAAGESRVFIVPKISRVAVGDPEIADITMAGKEEILVEAKSSGTTTLMHWTSDGARRSIEITVR